MDDLCRATWASPLLEEKVQEGSCLAVQKTAANIDSSTWVESEQENRLAKTYRVENIELRLIIYTVNRQFDSGGTVFARRAWKLFGVSAMDLRSAELPPSGSGVREVEQRLVITE